MKTTAKLEFFLSLDLIVLGFVQFSGGTRNAVNPKSGTRWDWRSSHLACREAGSYLSKHRAVQYSSKQRGPRFRHQALLEFPK
jgi:hypothetical protein